MGHFVLQKWKNFMKKILEINVSLFAVHVLALHDAVYESKIGIFVDLILLLKMLFNFVRQFWPFFWEKNRDNMIKKDF